MREFTQKEKELIVNTPIDEKCFDIAEDFPLRSSLRAVSTIGIILNNIRQDYLETKDERYFTELVRLLPSSYKVVKL